MKLHTTLVEVESPTRRALMEAIVDFLTNTAGWSLVDSVDGSSGDTYKVIKTSGTMGRTEGYVKLRDRSNNLDLETCLFWDPASHAYSPAIAWDSTYSVHGSWEGARYRLFIVASRDQCWVCAYTNNGSTYCHPCCFYIGFARPVYTNKTALTTSDVTAGSVVTIPVDDVSIFSTDGFWFITGKSSGTTAAVDRVTISSIGASDVTVDSIGSNYLAGSVIGREPNSFVATVGLANLYALVAYSESPTILTTSITGGLTDREIRGQATFNYYVADSYKLRFVSPDLWMADDSSWRMYLGMYVEVVDEMGYRFLSTPRTYYTGNAAAPSLVPLYCGIEQFVRSSSTAGTCIAFVPAHSSGMTAMPHILETTGSDLITNGDMEGTIWGTDVVPDTEYSLDTDVYKSAVQSVLSRVSTSTNGAGPKSNTFTTTSGTYYRLQYWVRIDSGQVQQYVMSNGGSAINNSLLSSYTADTGVWRHVVEYFTDPSPGASAYMKVVGNGAAGGVEAKFYLDDVSVAPVTSALAVAKGSAHCTSPSWEVSSASSDYFEVENSPSASPAAMYMAFVGVIAADGTLASVSDDGASDISWHMRHDGTSTISFVCSNDGSSATSLSGTVALDTPVIIEVAWSGATVYLYVDGELADSAAFSSMHSYAVPMLIGSRYTSGTPADFSDHQGYCFIYQEGTVESIAPWIYWSSIGWTHQRLFDAFALVREWEL